ncbi:MAG: single-stranded-DNA-specific exonuclease RecJ, partial [Chloroflexia bacterium]
MADAEISMADVTDGTMDSISRLAPFGSGNPLPLFMAKGVYTREAQTVGDGSHLKLHLADAPPAAGRPVEAIAFGFGRFAELIRRRPVVDLLFTMERREWRGEKHLQLRVKDIKVSDI